MKHQTAPGGHSEVVGDDLPGNGQASCTACEHAQRFGAHFCPDCGNDLRPSLPSSAQPSPMPSPFAPAPESPAAKPNSPAHHPGAQAVTVPPTTQPKMQCCCGANLPAEAQFCCDCGREIAPVGPTSPPEPMPTDLRLVWRSRDGQQHSIPLTAPELKIGKASDCELILTDNAYVSRKHTRITRRDGQLLLEDLNSSNGTFLRVNKPTKIEPGDEIIVGTTLLRVEGSGV